MKNWLDFFYVCVKRERILSSFSMQLFENNQAVVSPYLFTSLITEMHENDLHNELYRIKKP